MNTNGQHSTNFSPTITTRGMTLIKDDETVTLINSLSSSIKTYYQSAKVSLSDIKKVLQSDSNSSIEKIDNDLIKFLKEAKQIFQKLKILRNQSKVDFEPLFCANNSPSSLNSKHKQFPQKISSLSPQLGRTTLFSDKKQILTFQLGKQHIKTMNNDSEILLCLAFKVINFLSQLLQFEESILKRSSDINIKISKFDYLKSELMYLAKEILNSNNCNVNHNIEHNLGYNKENEGLKHINDSKENHIWSTIVEKNDNNSILMINKLKTTIITLQKEIKVLQQKNYDLRELLTIRAGSYTIVNKLHGYEAEIKRLKEIKSKCFSEKNISLEDTKMQLKSKNPSALDMNKSTLKDYAQINDQKEKLITILQNDIANMLDKGINQDTEYKKNPKMYQNNQKNNYKQKSNQRDFKGLSKTFNKNNKLSPSYSTQGEELSYENLNKKIKELTQEIIERNKELDLFKEEEAQKDTVVSACIKELTDLKELYENENKNLRDELNNKEEDNMLLTNELKLLTDQIDKLNIVSTINKSDKQSLTSYNIMAKNTIEYKKIYDELFKERKEKNELLNNKKLFNQEIIKLGVELQAKNDVIQSLEHKLIIAEQQIEQLNNNNNDLDNDQLKQQQQSEKQSNPSKVDSNNYNNESFSSSNIKYPNEEIANKNIQLESLSNQYIEIKAQFTTCQNECNMLKSTILSLSDKIILKEKLISELKQQQQHDNTQSNSLKKFQEDLANVLDEKNAEIQSAQKKVQELLESQKILRKIMKNKDSMIQELNDKIAKVTEMRHKVESDLEQMRNSYENKIKELSTTITTMTPRQHDVLLNPLYITLQNKLITLQSDYEMKCTMLMNKNKQIDVISTQNMNHENEIQLIKKTIGQKDNEILALKENTIINSISNRQSQVIFSPEKHQIICDKKYNNLHWYLLSIQDKQLKESYINTFWVEESKIINELSQYNKFQSEEDKEKETIEQINTIKVKMIKQLENKENEITTLTYEKKKLSDQLSNGNLTNSLNQNIKSNPKELHLLSSPKSSNNNDNSIPIEKYEKTISEVNELNTRLIKANTYILKLKNENKELSKNADDKSNNNKNEQGISFIHKNDNHLNKTSSFVDDEIKDVLEMGFKCKDNQNEEIRDFTELKTLIQILIHEMSDSLKIKFRVTLGDICKLIGFTLEETVKMLSGKNKKGGIF